MVACLISQKIDWIPLRFTIWNIITYWIQLQKNCKRCLNATYFSHNSSSTNKSVNLSKRQAVAGQRTVKLLLVLNDAHNPINNPTAQIVDPRKLQCSEVFKGNSNIIIQENARENVVWQMATILSRPHYVNKKCASCLIAVPSKIWGFVTELQINALLIQIEILNLYLILLELYGQWKNLKWNMYKESHISKHHILILTNEGCIKQLIRWNHNIIILT